MIILFDCGIDLRLSREEPLQLSTTDDPFYDDNPSEDQYQAHNKTD
jgi:hypothetical protein